ncbi:MAG: hypothetical protein QMD05_10465, partial [Candidatus Brocadiaceae bacterium]|nr:hypothetical protein [Candidatus Brocadiaceae bacterium]
LGVDGSVEWQKTYERGHFDILSSAQQTGDGGYIVAGDTLLIPDKFSKFDLLVFKLRPDGSVDPSCGFVKEADMLVGDSEARVWSTYAFPGYSDAGCRDSSAIVQDTDALVDLFCTSTDAKP